MQLNTRSLLRFETFLSLAARISSRPARRAALAGVGSILFLAGSATATTIDYVTAFSAAFGSPNITYDSVNGLSSTCCGNAVTLAGSSSTPSVNVLGLTAASNSLSATSFDANNNRTATASASAYASLATGMLGASGSGSILGGLIGPGSATAGAGFQDSITFNNTTGQTADINVYWTFDGTLPIDTNGSSVDILFCLASATACQGQPSLGVHGPTNTGQFFRLQDSLFLHTSITEPTTAQWVSTSFTQGMNADSGVFDGVFALPAGLSADSLNAYITLSCDAQVCDFSHTGILSFGGVGGSNGVSFTSDSGVLLTQTAAPEPGTWLLLAAGLGLLLVSTRRHRTAH